MATYLYGHLAKLTKLFSCVVNTYVSGVFNLMVLVILRRRFGGKPHCMVS